MIVADHTQILIIRNWIRCGSNRSIRQIFPKFSFLSSCCCLSCSCALLASHFCCPCLPYFFFDLMYFWPDDPTFLSAVTLIQLSTLSSLCCCANHVCKFQACFLPGGLQYWMTTSYPSLFLFQFEFIDLLFFRTS